MTSNSKQRVTLFLKPGLSKGAKVQAVLEGVSLTALVEKALIEYLPKKIIISKVDIEKRKVVK